jgi:hypothetical protein
LVGEKRVVVGAVAGAEGRGRGIGRAVVVEFLCLERGRLVDGGGAVVGRSRRADMVGAVLGSRREGCFEDASGSTVALSF